MDRLENIPTILQYLCRQVMQDGVDLDFLFMTIPNNLQLYQQVKFELTHKDGDLSLDNKTDIYILVKLLQSFFEELPEPLILYSLYSQAINFTAHLFNSAIEQL